MDAFDRDVLEHSGYVYTTSDKLSCRLANGRMSKAVVDLGDLHGKSVIDVGCGDGTYTMELLDAGAARVLGIDSSKEAIRRAQQRSVQCQGVEFRVGDAVALGQLGQRFDVAVVRGLLHHLDDAEQAIAAISAIADIVVVVEPNGYNPVLKLLERFSPYHVQHEEKSYPPHRLDRWFRQFGGTVESNDFVGLVPFFCPEPLARVLKRVEPLVEALPLLRRVCCGQYVQRIRTAD